MINKFSSTTIEKLKWYVYSYSDPETKKVFYVGKGKGNRVFDHLKDNSENAKTQKIQEIINSGKEPVIDILVHGLDEDTALKVEMGIIDSIGIHNLTNKKRGDDAKMYGKENVEVLDAKYKCDELTKEEITDNIIIIKINSVYRADMDSNELYERTRSYWSVNLENAKKTDYVLAVANGVVIDVFKVLDWFEATTTMNKFLPKADADNYINREDKSKKKYEFVGNIAEDEIRSKYKGKSVKNLYEKGEQNPIKYFLNKKF